MIHARAQRSAWAGGRGEVQAGTMKRRGIARRETQGVRGLSQRFDASRRQCKIAPMIPDPASLRSVFASQPVVLAYLFGSQASGTGTPLSDVDIAVLLEPNTPSPGTVQATLISDLMLALGRSDVDVVVLNTAPS